jgi:hypothetical protein
MARIPVRDFLFPEPGPDMFHLVCANHPEMEYLTKNPYMRSLHFVSNVWPECPCPFTDLVVLTDEDSRYKENAK